MSEPNLFDHVLAVVLGFVLPIASAASGSRKDPDPVTFDARQRIGFYWANGLALWMAALAVCSAWILAGRGLVELGLGPPRPAGWIVAGPLSGAVLVAYALDAWNRVRTPERRARTRERWRRETPFMPETGRELAHYLFLALSAGLCEEIVFRGHVVSWATSFTGETPLGLTLAVGLPALLFGAAHAYQGWDSAAKVALGAALFGAIYVASGSLWPPILLHAGLDVVGGLIGMRVLRQARRGVGPGD